jgi:hypothetical protein
MFQDMNILSFQYIFGLYIFFILVTSRKR